MNPQILYTEFVCIYVFGRVYPKDSCVAKAVIYTKYFIFNVD